MRWPSDVILKQLNRSMLVVIIISNGFLFLAPIWPNFNYVIQTHITKPVTLNINNQDSLAGIDKNANHLVIPRLQMDEQIFDGKSDNTVHQGVWRLPNSAVPGQNNNTVLVGHRFTYTGPSVFYHLDKLQKGDDIVLVYDGVVRVYRVDAIKVVEPTELSVEAPTNTEKLTLYTCTPLGSVRYRLVIENHLERTL